VVNLLTSFGSDLQGDSVFNLPNIRGWLEAIAKLEYQPAKDGSI
jgi:hypothetical protein